MKYKVQFTRYFEEFGFNDCDTKEFDNIKDANNFYNAISKDDKARQLWAGNDCLAK